MIQVQLNSSYLDSYRQVLGSWIQSQRSYHQANADTYRNLHRHLQFAINALFGSTLTLCFIHLVDHSHRIWLDLALGTIVLPALGGALGAILHIGEFGRMALFYRSLDKKFESLACELHCIGEAATSRDLGRLALDISNVSLGELIDWRSVFLEKDLELPAYSRFFISFMASVSTSRPSSET